MQDDPLRVLVLPTVLIKINRCRAKLSIQAIVLCCTIDRTNYICVSFFFGGVFNCFPSYAGVLDETSWAFFGELAHKLPLE